MVPEAEKVIAAGALIVFCIKELFRYFSIPSTLIQYQAQEA
jgi:hypothetical protein